MSTEKNTNREEKIFSCKWCEGIDEMMKDCFPDDAGFSECIARMQKMQGKHFSLREGDVPLKNWWNCCK